MPSNQTNLLQGTLDLLILKALALQEMHGLGISHRIGQITNDTFQVKPGSLFPALHRMEAAGWLASYWGESENNRRAKLQADGGRTAAIPERDQRVGENLAGYRQRAGHVAASEHGLGQHYSSSVSTLHPRTIASH